MIVHVGSSCDIIYKDPEESRSTQRYTPRVINNGKIMKTQLQFMSTPTADGSGTSLILHFDHKRYLIGNVSEGTQRLAMQRGIGLHKMTDMFLTGKTEWKNTGGVIGMILSLADGIHNAAVAAAEVAKDRALKKQRQRPQSPGTQSRQDGSGSKEPTNSGPAFKSPSITIHGGPNITHTLATARRFVFRTGTPVEVDEMIEARNMDSWEPTWSDENIRVWSMPLMPSNPPSPSHMPLIQSPRKRSFDDFIENQSAEFILDNTHSDKLEPQLDREIKDQQLRKAVVGHMFDSDWRLDALFETPIEEVEMPATLFFRDPETKHIEKYTGPTPGSGTSLPNINVLVRRPWPGALVTRLPDAKPSDIAMAYIFRGYPQRGKFNVKNAVALGVPHGPLFAKLTAGIPVELNNGTTVTPEQVLGETRPAFGFAVVEIPSNNYVQSAVDRAEWRVPELVEGLGVIVWILGRSVVHNQTLLNFMTEFAHVKHIVSSKDCCPNYLALDSAATLAIRLNQIDSQRYPVPIHSNIIRQSPIDSDSDRGSESSSSPPYLAADRGLTMEFMPSLVLQSEGIISPLNTREIIRATPKDVMYLAKGVREETLSPAVQKQLNEQDLPSPDAEVIFLGTGSASPSKYRNVSATLVRVPGSGSYLLDCGENTIGQLARVYSQDELLEVLRDLKMIWISHMHADHHLGTTSVIKAWYKAVYGDNYQKDNRSVRSLTEQLLHPAEIIEKEKLLFVASGQAMLDWLEEYSSVEDYGFDKLVTLNVFPAKPDLYPTRLDWNSAPVGFNVSNSRTNEAMRKATGLTDFQAVYVMHCHGSMGVSLTFPTGFKLTYSGDCRPSKALSKIGKGSTVLLHEATFDDELRGDAKAKNHSTTSEAIGVGLAMGARRTLLTHFSQRYQKIPVMADVREEENVILEDVSKEDPDDVPIGMEDKSEALIGTHRRNSVTEMVENLSPTNDILARNLSPTGSPSRRNSQGSHKIRRIASYPGLGRKDNDMKVGVAFDYMRVKVRDIALLEKFVPALSKLMDRPLNEPDQRSDDEKERDYKAWAGNQKAREKQKEKQKGNGKMGRVAQSREAKENVKSGKDLFDDADRGGGRKDLISKVMMR